MNTNQIECFLAVAESLNFARAAEGLHVTQPAVTHQINTLENELDAKLFQRTTRSVELTEAGFSFLGDARDILSMTHAAKARLSSRDGEKPLPLHIGCAGPLVYGLIPAPLKLLTERHPRVHPNIRLLPYQVLQSRLQEESLHVMFGFLEETMKKKAGSFVPLTRAPSVCVATPSHPLAAKKALSQKDLKAGSMIICDPHHSTPALSSLTASIIGARPLKELYFCDNQTCALTLIKAGLGFSILPDIIPVRDPELCYIPVEGLPSLSFGLYYKKLGTHPALKDFVEIMKEEFKKIPQT